MKNKQVRKKKSFLDKFFIKLIRKFGYEVIDQANLYIPSKDLEANQNLSEKGKQSINIPLGKTEILREVKSLTVIIRSYTFGDVDDNKVMLDQNKKRVFELPKIEYTLRTIKSVIKSCELAKKYFTDIDIKIIITDDKSNKQSLDRIDQVLQTSSLKTKLINLKENEFNDKIKTKDTEGKNISQNMISNMRNLYKSIQIAETEETDLFYFLEDDYIHVREAITEMLFSYEKISSQLNQELFLCPADYPYLYSSIDDSKIFFGNMRHWRSVNETLITFLTSKKMINKYLAELKLMSTIRHHPMELKLHEIYKKEYCISPIPSLAMHATNINSTYGLPPNFNWKKIWDENEVSDT
tara:strand:- start:567 stop:1625 length:1059 start_codon:yes stop_codon:yes gene_type:complete